MKSGKCSVGRASGQARRMSGKTTLFPRNDGGGQIENVHFQSKNAVSPLFAGRCRIFCHIFGGRQFFARQAGLRQPCFPVSPGRVCRPLTGPWAMTRLSVKMEGVPMILEWAAAGAIILAGVVFCLLASPGWKRFLKS